MRYLLKIPVSIGYLISKRDDGHVITRNRDVLVCKQLKWSGQNQPNPSPAFSQTFTGNGYTKLRQEGDSLTWVVWDDAAFWLERFVVGRSAVIMWEKCVSSGWELLDYLGYVHDLCVLWLSEARVNLRWDVHIEVIKPSRSSHVSSV